MQLDISFIGNPCASAWQSNTSSDQNKKKQYVVALSSLIITNENTHGKRHVVHWCVLSLINEMHDMSFYLLFPKKVSLESRPREHWIRTMSEIRQRWHGTHQLPVPDYFSLSLWPASHQNPSTIIPPTYQICMHLHNFSFPNFHGGKQGQPWGCASDVTAQAQKYFLRVEYEY